MRARVVGLGQPGAGDDGVGAAVIGALRERALPSGIELLAVRDGAALVELLDTSAPIVLVDAILGSPVGEVVELSPDQLAERAPVRLSSHGFGAHEAIELARTLSDGKVGPVIRIVAVTIAPPQRYQQGLSPAVAAAVPRAVERVLWHLEERHA